MTHGTSPRVSPRGSPSHSLLMPYQPGMGLHVAPAPQLSPQPSRSPKMGRRALQQQRPSHTKTLERASASSSSDAASPSPELLTETVTTVVEELVVRGLPAALSGTSPKGLDRVLLERNLERLLSDRHIGPVGGSGPTVNLDQLAALGAMGGLGSLGSLSPELERLLSARDRCRQPLHLANLAELSLSLDSWQPFSEALAPVRQDGASSMPELDGASTPPPLPPPPPPPHGHTSSPASPCTPDTPDGPTSPRPSPTRSQSSCASNSPANSSANSSANSPADSPANSPSHVTPSPAAPHPDKQPQQPSTSKAKSRGQLSVRFEDGNDCNSPTADAKSPGASTAARAAARERRAESRRARRARHSRDYDEDSYCSTCSSSSSSDESEAYQLPPRRAYGGVRISYVPNDALACARQRQHAAANSAALPRSPLKKPGGQPAGAPTSAPPHAHAHPLGPHDKNCVIS